MKKYIKKVLNGYKFAREGRPKLTLPNGDVIIKPQEKDFLDNGYVILLDTEKPLYEAENERLQEFYSFEDDVCYKKYEIVDRMVE